MTDELPRRRALACLGTGLAVGLAGCSGGGNGTATDEGESETTADDGDGGTTSPAPDTTTGAGETTGGQPGSTAGGGTKTLTLNLTGNGDYQSELVTVESLTFVAASENGESPTLDIGTQVDISKGSSRNPVTIAEDLQVPYGTYEAVEMTVSVDEVIDGSGQPLDVAGGTLSRSLTEIDDEPNTIEESSFDATLTLFLSVRAGQLEVTGYRASALG